MALVILCICLGLLLLTLTVTWVFLRIGIRRRLQQPRLFVALFRKSGGTKPRTSGKSREEDRAWFLSQAQDVWITSKDGLRLHGYFMPNDRAAGRYAIICHCYRASGQAMASYARRFYNMGYAILVPEARAHGESEGKYIGMGWPERLDIVQWMEYLTNEDPLATFVLHGVSMGGATVMMTAGEDLKGRVVAAIEDCGYTSVWDEFAVQIRRLHLPVFPMLHLASWMSRMVAGYDFREASCIEQLRSCKVPMLFIHGDKDNFVPASMLDEVFAAASCEKQKLLVPGAGHTYSAAVEPELYWDTVEEFLAAQGLRWMA